MSGHEEPTGGITPAQLETWQRFAGQLTLMGMPDPSDALLDAVDAVRYLQYRLEAVEAELLQWKRFIEKVSHDG